MPQIIQYIDAIAQKKKRDVLFVKFHQTNDIFNEEFDFDYIQNKARAEFIQWLEQHAIPYCECIGYVCEENMILPYLGQFYLYVPYGESNPIYQKLR